MGRPKILCEMARDISLQDVSDTGEQPGQRIASIRPVGHNIWSCRMESNGDVYSELSGYCTPGIIIELCYRRAISQARTDTRWSAECIFRERC